MFTVPVMVVIRIRHSDISQHPGETKPEKVLNRISYQQPDGDPHAEYERGQKAGKHLGPGPPQHFNPAMQPGHGSIGQAIINSADRFIWVVCVLKSERAGPVALHRSVLLREAMMIVHVMHLVAFEWNSVRNEAHPTEHFVQQVLTKDLQMRVIVLNQVQPSDRDRQDNDQIPR